MQPLLLFVKGVHTAVWFTVEAAMGHVLVAGFRRQTDRRVGVAAAIVAAESAVFLANGARCPLTGVAEALAEGPGSVTDIFLPAWLARNLPAIHVPLILLAVALHATNRR